MNDATPMSPLSTLSYYCEEAAVVTPDYNPWDDATNAAAAATSGSESDNEDDIMLAARQLCQLKASPAEFVDAATTDTTGDKNARFPMTVAEEEDELNVNTLHQFVRREAIEYFLIGLDSAEHATVDEEEASSSTDDNDIAKKREYPGRVGLRCKFCPHSKRRKNCTKKHANAKHSSKNRYSAKKHTFTKMSTVLPTSLANIYRAVCRF